MFEKICVFEQSFFRMSLPLLDSTGHQKSGWPKAANSIPFKRSKKGGETIFLKPPESPCSSKLQLHQSFRLCYWLTPERMLFNWL